MAVHKTMKHVDGLKELDALLDGLIDPKFRARALRSAAKTTMEPVKSTLESKLPAGSGDESSYRHYKSSKGEGYKSGDLKRGVITKVTVNTNKDIKFDKTGRVKGGRHNELSASVTFKPHLIKLAGILEHGRSKRVAVTRNGKVFHSYGKPTDATHRDIGTTEPRNFISETATQCEASMVNTFKTELLSSITKEAKRLERRNRKRNNARN